MAESAARLAAALSDRSPDGRRFCFGIRDRADELTLILAWRSLLYRAR